MGGKTKPTYAEAFRQQMVERVASARQPSQLAREFALRAERVKANRERPTPDLVEHWFVADASNGLFVADMTYVPRWAGFVYLAIVLDAWSRRVVGWQIGEKAS